MLTINYFLSGKVHLNGDGPPKHTHTHTTNKQTDNKSKKPKTKSMEQTWHECCNAEHLDLNYIYIHSCRR